MKTLRKSSRFKWALIAFIFIILPLIIWAICKNRDRTENTEEKFCPHHYSYFDEVKSSTRFLTEWECDYCGKEIEWGGNHPNPNQKITSPVLNSLAKEHLKNCERANEFISAVDLSKDNSLVYDDKEVLIEKGYHQDLDKLESWGLINRVIFPDLKNNRRIGVVKELTVIEGKIGGTSSQNYYKKGFINGNVLEEIVFLVPSPFPINLQNFSKLPKYFYFPCGRSQKSNEYYKIVCAFFVWNSIQKRNNFNHSFFSFFINVGKFMPISGESGTLAFYLALLSAYHQKPISRELATTGFLDIGNYSELGCCPWCFESEIAKNPERNLNKNKITPIEGLSSKISAAVRAGIKKVILSSEQRKEYEKNTSQKVKKKLKTYYVKNVEELEKLFWRGEFS